MSSRVEGKIVLYERKRKLGRGERKHLGDRVELVGLGKLVQELGAVGLHRHQPGEWVYEGGKQTPRGN